MRERQLAINVALAGFGMVYPAVVFFLRGSLDPMFFILFALMVMGLRLAFGNFRVGIWRPALVGVAVCLVALATLDLAFAARAYPVLLSLAVAFVFGATLVRPPSLIEQLALATGEPWSPDLAHYCRNVTLIWTFWLCLNAAIAVGFAISRDDRAWALWTGVISYAVSGFLFASEWLVRRRLKRG
jgi:uncharacterized membrane protein